MAARCCADPIERSFGMSKSKRARTGKARSRRTKQSVGHNTRGRVAQSSLPSARPNSGFSSRVPNLEARQLAAGDGRGGALGQAWGAGLGASYAAWEAAVLPLNYARKCLFFVFWLSFGSGKRKQRQIRAGTGIGQASFGRSHRSSFRLSRHLEPHPHLETSALRAAQPVVK